MARRRRTRAVALGVLGAVLAHPAGIRLVNRLHRRLSPAQKRRFFYAVLEGAYPVDGDWIVDFAGRPITLPLRRDFPLSWCAAVGFHGYDGEIHALYERLATAVDRPRVFFDVGASYGLHSLRWLVHGARAISFEPNPACHEWFRECCERNGVRPEIHAVAVADRAGTAELAVPDGATYEATIVSEVRAGWGGRRHVSAIGVLQVALDDFVADHGILPDLVKIDTEGSERLVLGGARGVLQRARPLVVFESWRESPDRAAIFAMLESVDYRIEPLGWSPCPPAPLSLAGFRGAAGMNFLARPQELEAPSAVRQVRLQPRPSTASAAA